MAKTLSDFFNFYNGVEHGFKKAHVYVGGDNSVGEIVIDKNKEGQYDMDLLAWQVLYGEIERIAYSKGDFEIYIKPKEKEEKK